jgi:hypothetical protein
MRLIELRAVRAAGASMKTALILLATLTAASAQDVTVRLTREQQQWTFEMARAMQAVPFMCTIQCALVAGDVAKALVMATPITPPSLPSPPQPSDESK